MLSLTHLEKVHADQNRVVSEIRLLIVTETFQLVRKIALTPLIFTCRVSKNKLT